MANYVKVVDSREMS